MSIVYIFANPSFPDFIKIGRCEDLDQRLASLSSNTALPLPFECVYACSVADAPKVERALHRAFNEYRVNPKREFFRMEPEPVIEILELLSQGEVEPSYDKESKASSEDESFLEALYEEFTFDQAAVNLGCILNFAPETAISCVVIGRNEVELENRSTTLTEATRIALIKTGKTPKITLSPARYWLYDNELLAHRKHQKLHKRLD